MHKDSQPENAERLMVLTDKKRGVLTAAEDLIENRGYIVRRSAKMAPLADILRVHDYNYLMKVI